MDKKQVQTDTVADVVIGDNKQQHEHSSRKYIVACVVLLVLMLIAAFGALLYQGSLSRASIAGIPVSQYSSQTQLEQAIQQKTESYELNVQYPDGNSKTFSLTELGVAVDVQASAGEALRAQKPANYVVRMQWWQNQSVPLTLTINEKTFASVLKKQITKTSTKPQNAKINIKNGKAALTTEKTGEGYALDDSDDGRELILAAIRNQSSAPLETKSRELAPAIARSDIDSVYKKAQTILEQKVVLKIDGRSITASPASIGKWLELSPVESAKTVDLSVNSGKVLSYINEIAKPYVQPPRSQVVLKKSDGSKKVLVAGKSGIDVVNKDALASTVAKKVLIGEGITADAPVKYANFKTISAKSYPKWIVVDTTNKRMYAYENTKLVKTFLVSAGAPQTPTVLGQYKISFKVRKQDMRGSNTDGSRYFQPNVEYVSYFYADYAIHGNYWRPTSYFGNVNSSHGCVGVVNNDAAWIYNWAPVGTPVIVHS